VHRRVSVPDTLPPISRRWLGHADHRGYALAAKNRSSTWPHGARMAETNGITVVGYGCDEMPAFYLPRSWLAG